MLASSNLTVKIAFTQRPRHCGRNTQVSHYIYGKHPRLQASNCHNDHARPGDKERDTKHSMKQSLSTYSTWNIFECGFGAISSCNQA